MSVEIKTVGNKLVSEARAGVVSIRYYKFDKMRVYKDRSGEVTNEVPFVEFAAVVTARLVRKEKGEWIENKDREQKMWLSPGQTARLKETMDEFELDPVEVI